LGEIKISFKDSLIDLFVTLFTSQVFNN